MNFRLTFDTHLRQLTDDVLMLASMVSDAVLKSMEALEKMDANASRHILKADQDINARRYQIENDVIVLIATQQPVGKDVRLLAAILEIITELERIGDYAKGICKIQLLLTQDDLLRLVYPDLKRMSEMGLSMLDDALRAFNQKDVALARAIPTRDDAVDALYNQVRFQLITLMLADMSHAQSVDYLVWAAHNLERLADRVTNICERIVYVFTGEMRELDDARGDEQVEV